MSVNKVILIGNAVKEPEVKVMQNGNEVANFSLAINESWTDKQSGEKKEKVEYHNIVVWGKLADIAKRFVKKGSKVYIEGKLQTRKWEQDGVTRYATEVVLQGFNSNLTPLDSKPNSQDDYNQTESFF